LRNSQQPTAAPDPNDPIVRIKDEGMNRSQGHADVSYLTDVIGPRLNGFAQREARQRVDARQANIVGLAERTS